MLYRGFSGNVPKKHCSGFPRTLLWYVLGVIPLGALYYLRYLCSTICFAQTLARANDTDGLGSRDLAGNVFPTNG